MLSRFAIAVLVGLAAIVPTRAAEVKLGTTSIVLTTPTGFCALIDGHPVDAPAVAGARKAVLPGHLLAQFADCGQLTGWRAGTRAVLDDVFHYATRPTMMQADGRASEAEIKGFCAYVRAEGAKMFRGLAADLKARVEAATNGVKVNESRLIGVVAEEPVACYWAIVQKILTDTGAPKTNIAVSAIMLVKAKLVTGVMTSLYANAGSLDAPLAKQRRTVAELMAANRP